MKTKSAFLLIVLATGVCLGQPTTAPATTYPAAPPGARITARGWFAPIQPGEVAPALPESVSRAYVIPIHGPISDTTTDVVKRKILRCKTGGAQIVIFDMDTPGGAGGAMEDIVRLILEELKGVYTVAYVHPEAISAGSVIALACNEIVMGRSARLGDAMPIMIGPAGQLVEMPEKERGKIESYFRALIRNLAERNGYDPLLCEAMITITLEVWEVRHRDTGELRYVDAALWRGQVAKAPASTQPAAVAPADAEWQYVAMIDGPMKLLTMTSKEALNLGFARRELPSMDDLKKHYRIETEVVVLKDTWVEKLVAFLTSLPVAGFLFAVAILCAYIEINTPGFGIPGSIAIACLAIIFGSRYLVGLANEWEIAIFVLGLVLLAVEIFLIPGFGVAGVLGILCCVVGLLAIYIPNAPNELPLPKTNLDWSLLTDGLFAMGVGFIVAIIAGFFVSKYLPKVPVASRLILAAAAAGEGDPVAEQSPMRRIHVGDVGVIEAMCRPVGKVRFGDDLLDAASEGGAISPGEKVRVLRHDGNRLIVERTEQT